MIEGFITIFGRRLKHNVSSPLEKGDHPELDNSDYLDIDGISIYQSMIGSLQWAVSLGRIDIQTSIMTMYAFRSVPREGHLDGIKRIYSYVFKMRHAAIRTRTEEPDFLILPEDPNMWDQSVYGKVREEIPNDIPKLLGKHMVTTVNLILEVSPSKRIHQQAGLERFFLECLLHM